MPPSIPTAKPRSARRARLPSLRGTPTPSAHSTPAPESAPREAAQRRNIRSCPGCSTPDLQENDGQLVCMSCGTVVSDSVIVNEITFGEAASGAPLVQGTTVHDGQRFAKSTVGGFRRGGRTSEETHENAMRTGKEQLTRLALLLAIPGMVDKAYNLYQMARIHQFQRPIEENAAICLYVACRQTKGNTTLLIDFAEQIKMNVFDLGATYKKFIKAISLEEELEHIPLVEIEPLLLKFAKRLEFGEPGTKQVANDAASILARMDRDWMVTGRQPYGLCGACLVLAARMNNYRRTVREVVFVVKASDITILKRLNEFQRTEAGRLTVQDFRQYGHRLKNTHDPPSLTESKAKRQRLFELGNDEPAGGSSTRHSSATPQASQQLRRDADGFAIPDRPNHPPTPSTSLRTASPTIEPSEDGHDSEQELTLPKALKRRRRPKKVKLPPVVVREEDLIVEGELEREISGIVQQHDGDERFEVTHARALALAEVEKKKQRDTSKWAMKKLPETEDIGSDEFADDPEVANCLLDEREVDAKEKIWVTHNADWLRAEQERKLKDLMEEAKGNKKKLGPRRKMGRRGDGSVLGNTPVSSPAEASHRMLEKRANRTAFSKHLNYDKLKDLYAEDVDSTSGSSPTATNTTGRSRTSSVSSSPAPRGRRPRKAAVPLPTKAIEATAGATQEQPQQIAEGAEVSDSEIIEVDDDPPPTGTAFEDEDDEEIEEENFSGGEDYDAELEEAAALGIDIGEYDD